MKKLFAKIPKDKLLHFVGGTYIYLIAQLFFRVDIALALVLIIATAIEVRDFFFKESSIEVLDIVFTLLGGFSAYWILQF